MFSLSRQRSIGDNTHRNDSSQLRLVTRLTSSRAIVEYYQAFPTITVERDPLCRDYNTRISSGMLASRYHGVSSIR